MSGRWTRARLLGLALALGGTMPAGGQDLAAVDRAVQAGIRAGLYPGAVVVIGRSDTILYAKGYGRLTWSSASRRPDPDSTLWDIASITKVVGTTSAVLRFVDAGLIDLDAPVARYLPRYTGGGKERVTIRMLLDHTSGLPAYVPLFRRASTAREMVDRLYAEPLQYEPGDTAVYSDLNAMLLGLAIEAVAGRPLDAVVRTEVLEPLRLQRTMFRPPRALRSWIAPSGRFGGRPVRGEVNDQNAARLGGVAGHAGLFSTGHDLARFAQVWLREGLGPEGQWVRSETIARFIDPAARSGSRLLGWDSPDSAATPEAPSVFGTLISRSAFGHTGWTGTELWVDPVHDLFLVFLTNRSYDPKARRSIEKLRLVRAQVSDAALRLVPLVCAQRAVVRC